MAKGPGKITQEGTDLLGKFFEENPDEAAIVLRKRAESIGRTRPTLAGPQGVEAQKKRTGEANFLTDLADTISPDKKG